MVKGDFHIPWNGRESITQYIPEKDIVKFGCREMSGQWIRCLPWLLKRKQITVLDLLMLLQIDTLFG